MSEFRSVARRSITCSMVQNNDIGLFGFWFFYRILGICEWLWGEVLFGGFLLGFVHDFCRMSIGILEDCLEDGLRDFFRLDCFYTVWYWYCWFQSLVRHWWFNVSSDAKHKGQGKSEFRSVERRNITYSMVQKNNLGLFGFWIVSRILQIWGDFGGYLLEDFGMDFRMIVAGC